MASHPRVDSVTHFTDEIGVVEFSTFREDLTIIAPAGFKIGSFIENTEGQIGIRFVKEE